MLIHERSGGIPRTVSVMCDNALLTGFGLGRQPVNYEMVLEVARDFDLQDMRPHDLTSASSPEEEDLAAPATEGEAVEQGAHAVSFASADPAGETSTDSPEPAEDGRILFNTSRTRPRFSFFGTR
jgi:hypothetical protein